MRYDDFTPEKADFETEDDFARFGFCEVRKSA